MQRVAVDLVRTPVRDLHAHAMPWRAGAQVRERRCNFRSSQRSEGNSSTRRRSEVHELARRIRVLFGMSECDHDVLRGQPSSGYEVRGATAGNVSWCTTRATAWAALVGVPCAAVAAVEVESVEVAILSTARV